MTGTWDHSFRFMEEYWRIASSEDVVRKRFLVIDFFEKEQLICVWVGGAQESREVDLRISATVAVF